MILTILPIIGNILARHVVVFVFSIHTTKIDLKCTVQGDISFVPLLVMQSFVSPTSHPLINIDGKSSYFPTRQEAVIC